LLPRCEIEPERRGVFCVRRTASLKRELIFVETAFTAMGTGFQFGEIAGHGLETEPSGKTRRPSIRPSTLTTIGMASFLDHAAKPPRKPQTRIGAALAGPCGQYCPGCDRGSCSQKQSDHDQGGLIEMHPALARGSGAQLQWPCHSYQAEMAAGNAGPDPDPERK
jgi:hypothetical protein